MTVEKILAITKGVQRYINVTDGGTISSIEVKEDKVYFRMKGQLGEEFTWIARLEESDIRFKKQKFIIENERGENLIDYAEEMGLSDDDCLYVIYDIGKDGDISDIKPKLDKAKDFVDEVHRLIARKIDFPDFDDKIEKNNILVSLEYLSNRLLKTRIEVEKLINKYKSM